MDYFLVFGLIGTLELALLYIPLYLLIFRKSKRTKLWHAIVCASLFGFGYSAVIFLLEGEANGVFDKSVSFAENVSIGLPLYLFIYTFLSVPMTIAYVVLNVILMSVGTSQKPTSSNR